MDLAELHWHLDMNVVMHLFFRKQFYSSFPVLTLLWVLDRCVILRLIMFLSPFSHEETAVRDRMTDSWTGTGLLFFLGA